MEKFLIELLWTIHVFFSNLSTQFEWLSIEQQLGRTWECKEGSECNILHLQNTKTWKNQNLLVFWTFLPPQEALSSQIQPFVDPFCWKGKILILIKMVELFLHKDQKTRPILRELEFLFFLKTLPSSNLKWLQTFLYQHFLTLFSNQYQYL